MTSIEHRQSRPVVVRIIASSLCFDQDPPVIRNLGKARDAADAIYSAMVAAGIMPDDGNGNGNGPAHSVDGAEQPLFPDNGIIPEDDPES